MLICSSNHKPKGITMSITVNIYYRGEGESARNFAEEMVASGTVRAIRSEPGNLRYEYYFPMEEKETVLLIDSWESQAALDAHHVSPMMQTIMELREKYDLHMEVQRYVSKDDVPVQDKAFLRE